VAIFLQFLSKETYWNWDYIFFFTVLTLGFYFINQLIIAVSLCQQVISIMENRLGTYKRKKFFMSFQILSGLFFYGFNNCQKISI
jgi:hypothetical protein